ncbi:MAG: YihY/virulence factor BrkB family protein [Gammaproteobacteria bacterium]|nr:YihY/virulence factor BrkB family protein [Gammaproteobacteria bacterium]
MEGSQSEAAAGEVPAGARLGGLSGADWRAAGKQVFARIGEHNLPLIAAGVAFYGMLAVFPALTALISVYRLVADPADVQRLLNMGMLPPGVAGLLQTQSHALASANSGNGLLGLGVIIGFLLTLWSARQGATAIITALNIAHGGLEPRGLTRRIGLSLAVTTASILFAVIALIAVVVLPALLTRIDLGSMWGVGITVVRWAVLVLLVGAGLAVLYRFVPNRHCRAWRWVACGAALATVAWLIGSALFSLYVSHFASYNRMYGAIGTVVVLLLWLFISALVVLLGAEFNAAIESRAARDKRAEHQSASEPGVEYRQ